MEADGGLGEDADYVAVGVVFGLHSGIVFPPVGWNTKPR